MKRNKMILSVLVLSVIALVFSGCGTVPSITQKGSISGRIMVPDNFKKGTESWTCPLTDASVDTIDSEGKKHMATTDNDGYYTIFDIAPGYNYIITAEGTKKGSTIIIKDVAEQVKEGDNYNAGTADAESTTLALVLENIAENPETDIENISLSDIKNYDNFEEAVDEVSNSINAGNNVTTDPLVSDAIESVDIPPSIITPVPTEGVGALWGYLYSKVYYGSAVYEEPIANGYVFAVGSDGTVLGYSKTQTIAEGGYSEAGWWNIFSLPVGEEFSLIGFHPDATWNIATCNYEITSPIYQMFDSVGGIFYAVTYSYDAAFQSGIIGIDKLLMLLSYNYGVYVYDNWIESVTSELLSQVEGYIDEDEEKTEILIVLDNFDNAIVNQNWATAKSYCVVGSEMYESVDEFKDLWAELETLCDNITVGYDYKEILSVKIDGKFAEVTRFVTGAIACIPPGYEEEVVFTFEGEETYYLEKIENSWKLYGGEAGEGFTEIIEPKLRTFRK